jgi:biofilm PGA synthesis lipoprotein PgaB
MKMSFITKKGLCPMVIVLVALMYFCPGMEHPGSFFALRQGSTASVAHAGSLPEEMDLPQTGRLLGAQVLLFNCRSYEEVEERIMELSEAGVNTLIVRSFQNRGDRFYGFARPRDQVGVYFETEHAPVVDPLLAKIVSIGHRHGLRVFAWMETRKMPLRLSDPEESKALRYDFERRTLQPISMWSIFDNRVVDRLVALYRDVARTGVDGILFQDDLIMYQYEDFSPMAVAVFEQEVGEVLSPSNLYRSVFKDSNGRWYVREYYNTFWTWSRWKNQKLLGLAQRLIHAAKEVNPRIQFALNFMYESVTHPKNAMAWLSQNIEESKKFPIDFYAIMAYHRQIKKELCLSDEVAFEKIATMTAKLLKCIGNPNRILMKIQIRDWETSKKIPSLEVDEVLRRINSQGRVSLAFVPYSANTPLDVIRRHFQETSVHIAERF